MPGPCIVGGEVERSAGSTRPAGPGAGTPAGEAPVPHLLTRVWRRLDVVSLEYFTLQGAGDLLLWSGQITTVVGGVPHLVHYSVVCDRDWSTREARVHRSSPGERASTALVRDPAGNWIVDGVERRDLSGALDLDIEWTPSTNTLPIRRLDLGLGESREVEAAWIRLPGLAVERLSQRYTRLGSDTYRYESSGGRFVAELTVDGSGFVARYGDLWECVGKG